MESGNNVREVVSMDEGYKWYSVQTASNYELRVKKYIDKFAEKEGVADYIKEVLVPTKSVVEVKGGKKVSRTVKFYPGYVFINMRAYDDDGGLCQQVVSFVKSVQGVAGFMGGDKPIALKKAEIDGILSQLEETKGKKVLKVAYEVGDFVKINDGPFFNLTGTVDEVDPERGKLKVSVSIFGRFTPVELEYWQVQRDEEE